MINDPELPYGGDVTHAGDRYGVVDPSNPWGLPVGVELVEVRRGEFWDNAPPLSLGNCWVWLRMVSSPGTRERPVLIEVLDEDGARTWACPWLEAALR
jgi:hypothetical protein